MSSGPARRRGGGLEAVLGPIAGLVTRRPRLVLVGWVVVIGLLALKGVGLEDRLSTRPVYIDGTATQRAHTIVANQFGSEDTLVVMLRGPRAAVSRQGRELTRRIDALPNTLVVSPWRSDGAIDGLRPSPEVAALLVNVDAAGRASADIAARVRSEVDEVVAEPVRPSLAGAPAIIDSLRDSIKEAADFGEKLAIPVLLIVLLLVCRSFIAAAMPVLIGGSVVAASKGVLDLLHGIFTIDPFAIGVAAMLGLALGVDYSLLVVSRFREETRAGKEVPDAARTTLIATGRSVIPAGSGLLLAMLVASRLMPGAVVSSIALAGIVVAVLSVLSAMFVAPALLMVLGRHLDRWSLPPRRDEGGAVMRWSTRILSRMPLVLGVLFVLVVCAGWALTLDTKTGSIAQLPPDDPGRQQQEDIQRALGPGWVGPLEVAVNGRDRPVTTPGRLRALADFQRRVERDPGVASMAGFTSFEESRKQLGGVEKGLESQEEGMGRLSKSISRAHDGATATTDGFLAAADGASALDSAVGTAQVGSGRLANRLRSTARARSG